MKQEPFYLNLKQAVFCVLFLFSFPSSGQEITFEHIVYGTREGLPSSETYEILQDKRGNIWFSTDAGISRFDGYEFENFNTNDGLTDNTVFHMYEDFKGRIWFLTFNFRLCYFEEGKIHPFKYNDKLRSILSDQYIRSISIDSNETMTFTGNRFGLGSIKKNGTLTYQATSKTRTGKIGFYQNGKDLLAYRLKSLNGENRTDLIDLETKKEPIVIQGEKYGKHFDFFPISPDEFLFNVDDVLGYKKGGEFKSRQLKIERPILNKAYIDNKGRVWLAYYNDGIKIYRNCEEAYNGDHLLEHLFEGKNISSIFEDNSGGIWLAVQNNGVYYIPTTNVKVHLFGNDELENRVISLYKSDMGGLFAGTSNGNLFQLWYNRLPELVSKSKSTKEYLKLFRVEENENDKTLHLNHQITTRNKLIIQYTSSGVIVKSNEHTIYGNNDIRVNKVFEDSQGNVWMGTNDGLFMYKG